MDLESNLGKCVNARVRISMCSQDAITVQGLYVLDDISNVSLRAGEARLTARSLFVRNASVFAKGQRIAIVSAFGWPRLDSMEPLNLSVPIRLNVLHNTSSWHALPAFIAELSAARWHALHARSNGSSRDNRTEEVLYAVYNHPLPLTAQQEMRVKLALSLLSALFILIPFCYIPATAAVFVVRVNCQPITNKTLRPALPVSKKCCLMQLPFTYTPPKAPFT